MKLTQTLAAAALAVTAAVGTAAADGNDESVSADVNPKIRDDAMEHVVDVSNGVFRVDGETAWTAGQALVKGNAGLCIMVY